MAKRNESRARATRAALLTACALACGFASAAHAQATTSAAHPTGGAAVTAGAAGAAGTTGAIGDDARAATPLDRRIGAFGVVDEFHPARQPRADGSLPPLPEPAYGGSFTQHVEYMPPSLNHALDNKGITRWILHEVHETLARHDPLTLELVPCVARAWDVADAVLISAATAERLDCAARCEPWNAAPDLVHARPLLVRGSARSLEDGGVSVRCDDGSTLTLARSDLLRTLRGCSITLELRDDVHWQDGHLFDADDVAFSIAMYSIPGLQAGELRYEFEKIGSTRVLGPYRVRCVYREPYFAALDSLLGMCLVPRHLYDLLDPDNAVADPEGRARVLGPNASANATPSDAARAKYVAENAHNSLWIGLGPWRVTRHDSDVIEARRFDGYFDPSRAGYLDVLRWRYFRDDASAFQALLAGEIDFTYRVASADYFGAACRADTFTRNSYKGMFPAHAFGALIWNTRRELLSDARVRRALAHAIELERYKTVNYRGVAELVTGVSSHLGPAYDATIEPLRYDPALARRLFADAGWEDHDGDGRLDRDGVPFELEFVMQAGNPSSRAIALLAQEALRALGGELRISELEGKLSTARVKARDFDVAAISWIPPLEQDQEQLFHSRWAPPELDSSNYAGFADAEVDAWIDAAQRELDDAKRYELWKRVQRRVYELQPLLYLYSPPRKYALSLRVRGFCVGREEPGWSARDLYYPSGTSGTRAAR